jgi:ATP-dependent exoDNAse (exonuclease V) beta subunit
MEQGSQNYSPNNGLTVYRASAGSGKTYTLTLEYLKQALSDGSNANKFRNILAVTFTNKATDEMKARIITVLNSIASGDDTVIVSQLCRELNIDRYTLKDRAARVQKAILHNYSSFAISTIDRFFQRVLHSFVREAGLRPGFKLELDHDRLLDEAVDRMMMSIHTNRFLYAQMSGIIDEQMEKGRTWDIRRMLKNRGNEVLKEQFRGLSLAFHSKIGDAEFMTRFIAEINHLVAEFEKRLTSISLSAISAIDNHNLQKTDFWYGKNGPVAYFYKLKGRKYDPPTNRVYSILASEAIDAWCGKKVSPATKNRILQISPLLTALLGEAVRFYDDESRSYFTALCIKKSVGHLVFFAEIEACIRAIASDENLMPISETTHLLGTLINESDTPFIYEMTGTQYKTFMIDEFQDTSEAQWHNFRPLLKNSLSEGRDSLVVGDVKQSIYRWRNGDWRILSNKIFTDFSSFVVHERNLDTNWRSFPCVIEFNNALFSALPSYIEQRFIESFDFASVGIETDILSSAYRNVEQKIAAANRDKGGYVSLSLIRDEKEERSSTTFVRKAKEKIMEQLPLLIADIQDRGYRAGDIAILVRKSREGQEIGDCLLNYKRTSGDEHHCFDILSQDALYIKNSATVQFIISLFRTTLNPDDRINNVAINSFLNRTNPDFQWNESDKLDDELCAKLAGLTALSLPEAFERLIRMFNLGSDPIEIPYIQELHDMVISFASNELSDISSFVSQWDETGMTKKLSEGQTPDAITITTVHKSKGLEYPVVIIPFCNWDMKPSARDTVWVNSSHSPFDRLPHVLINYGTDMSNSHFAREYYYETIQSLVDNLNVMYVAFTRAKAELHIMLPLPKLPKTETGISGNINSASSALSAFLKDNPDFMGDKLTVEHLSGDDIRYISGAKRHNISVREQNDFSGILITEYRSSAFDRKLRLRLQE